MADVILSSKNQIVIPREARKALGLKPGDELVVVPRGNCLIILEKPKSYAAAGLGLSRSDCKPLADAYDFDSLRKSVLIPSGVDDSSLRTDGPFAYRDLDHCLGPINEHVGVIVRFGVVGYMGHL
jgi:AbrB family looped-hinge helix DNA binding protein